MSTGMLVYRGVMLGLVSALVFLMVNVLARGVVAPRRSPHDHHLVHQRASCPTPTPVPLGATASVVDVSRSVAGDDPIPLLGLHPYERVLEVDGVAADTGDLIARWRQATPGGYLDVSLASGGDQRRILILIHP